MVCHWRLFSSWGHLALLPVKLEHKQLGKTAKIFFFQCPAADDIEGKALSSELCVHFLLINMFAYLISQGAILQMVSINWSISSAVQPLSAHRVYPRTGHCTARNDFSFYIHFTFELLAFFCISQRTCCSGQKATMSLPPTSDSGTNNTG